MRRLLSLFGFNDRLILAAILVLSVTAGRLPDIFDSRYLYPTTLYSIFGTMVQGLAPFLAVVLFLLIYEKGKGGTPHQPGMVKGAVLLGMVVLLALVLIPFSEPIYNTPGVRQGVVAGITLMALWSVGQTVYSIVRRIMNDE